MNSSVDSYISFGTEEQEQVGVHANQGAPLLADTIIGFLSDMRSHAPSAAIFAEVEFLQLVQDHEFIELDGNDQG